MCGRKGMGELDSCFAFRPSLCITGEQGGLVLFCLFLILPVCNIKNVGPVYPERLWMNGKLVEC